MKSASRWVVDLILCLAAPASLADPLRADVVGSFIQICGETHGNADRALAVADREGWEVPPARALEPPTFDRAHWTYLDGRILRSPSGVRALEVGTQTDPGGRGAVVCAVTEATNLPASSAEMSRLRDALARWVGGAPVQMDEESGFAKLAFREVGGQRRSLSPGDPALSADLPPPDVTEVSLHDLLGKPTIIYMRWR